MVKKQYKIIYEYPENGINYQVLGKNEDLGYNYSDKNFNYNLANLSKLQSDYILFGGFDNKKIEELLKTLNIKEIFDKINLDELLKKIPWSDIVKGLDVVLQAVNFIDNPLFDFIIRTFLNLARIGVSIGVTAGTVGTPMAQKVIDVLFICLSASKLLLGISRSFLVLATRGRILELLKTLTELEFVGPRKTEEQLEAIKKEYGPAYRAIIDNGLCKVIQSLITKLSSVIGDAVSTAIPYQSGVLSTVIPEAINIAFFASQGAVTFIFRTMVDFWENMMDPVIKDLFMKQNMILFIQQNFGELRDQIKNLIQDDKAGDQIIDRLIDTLDPLKIQQVIFLILKPMLQALIITLEDGIKPDNILKNILEAQVAAIAFLPLTILANVILGPFAAILAPIVPYLIILAKNYITNLIKIMKEPMAYEHIDVNSYLKNEQIDNVFIKIKSDVFNIFKEKVGDFIKRTFLKDIIKQIIYYLLNIINDIIKDKEKIAHSINNSFALVFSFSKIIMVDCMGPSGQVGTEVYDISKGVFNELQKLILEIKQSSQSEQPNKTENKKYKQNVQKVKRLEYNDETDETDEETEDNNETDETEK
jgi:hypothetical protein